MRVVSNIADGLGFLGWRSPIRSTAITVLKNGVTGTHDPSILAYTKPLNETLTYYRATTEDRLFARMALNLLHNRLFSYDNDQE
jgi:hypothetical protein